MEGPALTVSGSEVLEPCFSLELLKILEQINSMPQTFKKRKSHLVGVGHLLFAT